MTLSREQEVEKLSAELHDIYQKEARRQEGLGIGSRWHYDEYHKLSEPVKDFDRVLARFILDRLGKEYRRGIKDAEGTKNGAERFMMGYDQKSKELQEMVEGMRWKGHPGVNDRYYEEAEIVNGILDNILSALARQSENKPN